MCYGLDMLACNIFIISVCLMHAFWIIRWISNKERWIIKHMYLLRGIQEVYLMNLGYIIFQISLVFWKLCYFRQCSNFSNCQQFFHHNFRLKWKFWILMVDHVIQIIIHMIMLNRFSERNFNQNRYTGLWNIHSPMLALFYVVCTASIYR